MARGGEKKRKNDKVTKKIYLIRARKSKNYSILLYIYNIKFFCHFVIFPISTSLQSDFPRVTTFFSLSLTKFFRTPANTLYRLIQVEKPLVTN